MWKEWVLSLCALCAAAALSDMLLPSGPMKKGVRLVSGLALMRAFAALAAEAAGRL